MGPAFFATQFSPAQQALLQACRTAKTLRALVEAAPQPDGEVLAEMVRLQEMCFLSFTEPEIKVRVVTDSTCDLPPEVARVHGIEVVPLSVIFGTDIYKDGPDLTPGGFYKLLETRKEVHPRTNPPTTYSPTCCACAWCAIAWTSVHSPPGSAWRSLRTISVRR